MYWIAENAFAIWAVGAIALAAAVAVYWETRTTKSFVAICVVVVVTAALLVAEHVMETPREAVTRTLKELAATVEHNDVSGALSYISPKSSQIRTDVEKLMPQAEIDMARIIAGPQIEFNDDRRPTQAIAKLRGAIRGKVNNTSMQGTVPEDITVFLDYDGTRWLISDYQTERDWTKELRR